MWSVQAAKARLSEVMRRAQQGEPQTIGTRKPCIVVSADQFAREGRQEHLGRFLIATAPRGEGIARPSRSSRRGDPFADS